MRLGIDLGGTKIEAALLSSEGRFLWRQRLATPRGSYEDTLAVLHALVSEGDRQAGRPLPLGIGIPGTLSPKTGLVKNANSVWLNGQAFDRDLEVRLKRPVRIANDANCFALSEAVDGAASGAQVVFGAILGTGIGGGIAVGGRVHSGANAIAGEWGHTPLPWPRQDEVPGPVCWCGRRGCLEAWCSGPAVEALYAHRTGQNLSALAIHDAARSGVGAAADVMADWLDRMGRGFAVIVDILDPDMIVLGGGLSNMAGLCPALEAAIAPHVFSDGVSLKVCTHVHGDSSGVRGAAWLWPDNPS